VQVYADLDRKDMFVVGLNVPGDNIPGILDNRHGWDADSDRSGPYSHQKACSPESNFRMSKAPRRPSQRDDLRRWDNEGGAPRSGHPSHEPHLAPEPKENPALYCFNVRTPHGLIEDPEGETYPSLRIARKDALAKARVMITDGEQQGEDRHDWSFEIMDRANQLVLTVAFSATSNAKVTSQGEGL